MYTTDVVSIVKCQSLLAHQYANETDLQPLLCKQFYVTLLPLPRLHRTGCKLDGYKPTSAKRSKTELMWLISPRQQHQFLPVITFWLVLSRWQQLTRFVIPVSTWTATCQWGCTSTDLCARASHPLASPQHLTIRDWRCSSPVSSFWNKLDYCNVVLAGLPQCDLVHLQSVISDAAPLITVGA